MNSYLKKIFTIKPQNAKYIRPVLGVLILLVGLISMFLPFLPLGYLFTFGGLFLLAPNIPVLNKLINRLEEKDDKGRVEKAKDTISNYQKKTEDKLVDNDRG